MASKEVIEVLKKIHTDGIAGGWEFVTDATSDGTFDPLEPNTLEEMISCVDAVDIVTVRAYKDGQSMGVLALTGYNEGIDQILDYTVDNPIAEILDAEMEKYS